MPGVEQDKGEAEEPGAAPLRDSGMPPRWEGAAPRQSGERQPTQGDGQRQQQARQAFGRATEPPSALGSSRQIYAMGYRWRERAYLPRCGACPSLCEAVTPFRPRMNSAILEARTADMRSSPLPPAGVPRMCLVPMYVPRHDQGRVSPCLAVARRGPLAAPPPSLSTRNAR
jgi:hypothetical protein